MTLPAPQKRSIPTQEFLEGLARLHPLVLLVDHQGRIQWMSDALRVRLSGDPSVAVLAAAGDEGLVDTLKAHLPDPDQLQKLRSDLVSNGRADRARLDIQTAQGTRICVEASAFAVESAAADAQYVVIARPRDPLSQGDPQARVELLSQIVDSSPHGVVVSDSTGYVTHANPQAAALLGRSEESLLGSPIAVFLPKSREFEDLLTTDSEPTGWDSEEIEHVDGQGRSSWVSVSTRTLRDASGSTDGVIAYLRDVTERREVQRQLERKNQELESYVDSVAHDLRSPLVSLLGFTRLLKQDYHDILDDTGHHFLERVEQAGRTMDALIHDLLELSRIRRPGEILSVTDPRRILLQLEAELKLRLEENDVVLELPEDPPMMGVDGTRLYQVFSNLIGNALTYGLTDRKSPSRVRVQVLDRDATHEIVVSDDGRGIPTADHDRIFQVFQTGSGVRRGDQSHGIGLAIVKKIAEAHSGRVWVESAEGRGADFHVVFPHP